MKRIDAYFMYQLGALLAPVKGINYYESLGATTPRSKARFVYFDARNAVRDFQGQDFLKLRSVRVIASELFECLDKAFQHCSVEGMGERQVEYLYASPAEKKLADFEAVLRAEMGSADIFHVGQKSAFDTQSLILNGDKAFPAALETVGKAALDDAKSAMRCIAFELPTAAAFHLHRANESILGLYWDAVTGDQERPSSQTLGAYLGELTKNGMGDDRVISALKQIKDLHRNPTVHADHSLENVEEAIDLFGIVRSAIGFMLAEIIRRRPVLTNALADTFCSSN